MIGQPDEISKTIWSHRPEANRGVIHKSRGQIFEYFLLPFLSPSQFY